MYWYNALTRRIFVYTRISVEWNVYITRSGIMSLR